MLFRVAKGLEGDPEHLAWLHLGIPVPELPLIAGDRDTLEIPT